MDPDAVGRLKAIVTRFIPEGRLRKGRRMLGTDGVGNYVTIAYDDNLNTYENHRLACEALMRKMSWEGIMIGSWLDRNRYCWVWAHEEHWAQWPKSFHEV